MLHGTALYGPTLTDVNPPLIFWASMLPEALANALHASPLLLLRFLVCALIATSVTACCRILRSAGLLPTSILVGVAALSLAATELSITGNDFGQREHLLLALLLPWLLYTLTHLDTASAPLRIRVPLAVAAGVGICFKPQQVAVLVAFELFCLVSTRRPRRLLRGDLLLIPATGLAYIAATRVFAPGYLTQNVAVLTDVYWSFAEDTPLGILRHHTTFNILFALTVAAALLLRRHLRYPAAPMALLAATAGAALAFALQTKDWPYQFFPQEALLATAVLWLTLEILNAPNFLAATSRRPRLLEVAVLLMTCATLPALLRFGRQHNQLVRQSPDSPFLDRTLAALPVGTRVSIFGTRLVGGNDLLEDHLVWANRYAHFWALPAIAQSEFVQDHLQPDTLPPGHALSPDRTAQLAAQLRANVAEDLRLQQPHVVLVTLCVPTGDEPCQGLHNLPFAILPWLLRSPAVADQWRHYQRTAGDAFFDVYQRSD